MQEGALRLVAPTGTFGGSFTGSGGGTLRLSGDAFTFGPSSSVSVPNVSFETGASGSDTVIQGSYEVSGSTTVQTQNVTFAPGSTVSSVGDTLTITSSFLNGVVFDSGQAVTVPNLVMAGGALGGSDDVTISNSFTWGNDFPGAGQVTGSGMLIIPDGVTLEITGTTLGSSPTNHVLEGRMVDNGGTITFTGTANLAAGEGAVLNNLASGVIDVQNDGNVTGVNGTFVTVNNAGAIQKSGGTATSTWEVCFNAQGGTVGVGIDIQDQCP